MADRWHAVTKSAGRAKLVTYGPFGDRLPARFTAQVDHPAHPMRMRLSMSFDGTERVKVESVTVERTDGQSMTPEDMTRLQLARVVNNAVLNEAVKHPGSGGAWWGVGRDRPAGPPTDDELRLLARMYWHEFVSWGKPRQAVMAAFDLPRSTANHWIRKARERHELPGPHADFDDGED
jgi:hypothetical protein